jgi:hypothetical protein
MDIGCRLQQSVRRLGCRQCERTAMSFYLKTLRRATDLMSKNQTLTLSYIGRFLPFVVYRSWASLHVPIPMFLFRAYPTWTACERLNSLCFLWSICMTHHISAIVELVYFAMRSRLQVWWDAIEIENHQIDNIHVQILESLKRPFSSS